MPNKEHIDRLKNGKQEWNAWRSENPDVVPRLRNAELSDMDLSGYDLHDAYLRKARLRNTILDDCKLREANLSGADLTGASMVRAELAGANLRGAMLASANLSEANLMTAMFTNSNLSEANLVNASVYGISAWDANLSGANQAGLRVNRPDQPNITVDDLEIAQLVFLLIDHRKLRNVLDATTTKCVLILGRFGGGGLDVLHGVGGELRNHGFLPIVFDFERPHSRTLTEAIIAFASLSAFVVVDLSGRSVPQELQATVHTVRIPFVSIIERDASPHSMVTDLAIRENFLYPPVNFDSLDHLIKMVPSEIIAPAVALQMKFAAQLQTVLDGRN